MGRFRPSHSVVLASLVLAVPNAAAALDLEPYGSLYGGLSLLKDAGASDNNTPDAEFDPGFVVGGALGARVVDAFTSRIELDLSYRRHTVDSVGNDDGDGDVHAFAALVNYWLDLINKTPITPYLGGGVGGAWVMANEIEQDGTELVDDDDVAFAYQLGAGLAWEVSPKLTIGVDYRWFEAVDPDFEDAGGNRFESEYRSHNVIASLRFGFW